MYIHIYNEHLCKLLHNNHVLHTLHGDDGYPR